MTDPIERPAPLVPAEVDLRDFSFMPVEVARVRSSGLTAEQTPAENWAAFLLWCACWHQVPAGSMPDSEIWQATQAGYARRGRIDPEWSEIRDGARRGYVTCNDGRLYHPVICEKALEAWEAKRARHARTAAATAARQAEREAKRRAEEEAQSKARRGSRSSRSTSQKSSRERNVHQGTGTGTGTGTLSSSSVAVEPESAALSAHPSTQDAPKGTNLELIPTDPPEENGADPHAPAPREPAARASKKCPEGFRVSPELREWARMKAPGVDIDSETESFRDHTFASARSDWDGTWRNWIRRAATQRGGALRPGRPSYAEQAAATGAAWRGEVPRGAPAGDVIDMEGGGSVRRIEG